MNYKGLIITISIILVIVVAVVIAFRREIFHISNPHPYKSVWDGKSKSGETHMDRIKLLLKNIDTVIGKSGIDMISFYGTLLGLARHKGLIPWDDDTDVIIPRKEKKKLLSLKDELIDVGIGMAEYNDYLVKLYDLGGEDIPNVSWKWPFVDFFFYTRDGDYIEIKEDNLVNACDSWWCNWLTQKVRVPYDDMFPLKSNLFEGIPISMPNNTNGVLNILYGKEWESVCVSSGYDHRAEHRKIGGMRVMCKDLEQTTNDILNHVWVINLDSKTERWQTTQKRLRKLGLEPKRWAATNAKDPKFETFYNSIDTDRSRGEVACYISHYSLWEHLKSQDVDNALIFEDDVVAAPSLTLNRVMTTINDSKGFNILLLGYCGEPVIDIIKEYALEDLKQHDSRPGAAQCTHAYAVSKSGLVALTKHKPNFTIAVDEFTRDLCYDILCYITKDLENKNDNIFGKGFFHQDETFGSDIVK